MFGGGVEESSIISNILYDFISETNDTNEKP